NQQAFKEALIQVQAEFGTDKHFVINGEKIFTDDKYDSVNPADHQQVLGRVSKASKEQVDQAMEAAKEAYKTWRKWTPHERAELLLRVSAIIRRRKHEFSALMVYEAGKPWNRSEESRV